MLLADFVFSLRFKSVAREYGREGIHVAHVVVDGLIESDEAKSFFGFKDNQRFRDGTVSTDYSSLGDDDGDAAADHRNLYSSQTLRPDEIAKNYLFLALQSPSTWTFELDLRPAKEHF